MRERGLDEGNVWRKKKKKRKNIKYVMSFFFLFSNIYSPPNFIHDWITNIFRHFYPVVSF